jgi:hypothetical protein
MFAALAAQLGAHRLREVMAELYQVRAFAPLGTDELERFLFCKTGDEEVRQIFHRFVHGLSGTVERAPRGACD